MLSRLFMHSSPFISTDGGYRRGFAAMGTAFLFLFLLNGRSSDAQTVVFNQFIRASDNPFSICPPGTDTIFIRDSFIIDVNYEPIIGGIPFQGVLIVDDGVIDWVSNTFLKLGYPAKVILINGGLFRPISSNATDCNGIRALYFDTKKTVNCNGIGAPHAFSDVNLAGCVTEGGICCNALIVETDSSGTYNDLTLCHPGDTARIGVTASGQLGYSFFWSPNIGPAAGPYPVAPTVQTNYSVFLSAVFNPYGGDPPYVLTCSGAVTMKINPPINISASATSVPCAGVPSGSVNLTVTGGTPPYTYLWSNAAITKNLTNVPAGTYTVTVNDAKGCGNTFTATVQVLDNTPPTITCPANATGIANPGSCTTLIPNIDAQFTDNCPTVGITYALTGATTGSGNGQPSNNVLFSSGVTTLTYTVNDGANAVSCSIAVTVQDNQLPTASNPAPLSGIACLAALPAPNPAVVTNEADNCGTPTVTFLNDNLTGGGGCPGDTMIVLRRYRVSDAAGNSITVTQTIRVVDNQPPAFIAVPGNTTVSCQSIPAVGTPAASDNCSAAVNVVYNGETRTDGACPDSYTLTRKWTATDNCGNAATTIQLITVQDNIQPVFTAAPVNITVSCEALPAVGSPAATDNCDAAVTITYNGQTRTDGTCPDTYSLVRRWTATDNCGNTKTTEQIITVQDLAKPVFTAVPANVTVNCEAVPAVGTPAASDNCDAGVSIVYNGQTRTDGICPDAYSLTRRWTATDNCGNTVSTQQVISVRDITSPVFTSVPANATVNCDAIPGIVAAVASDNCSSAVTVTFVSETRVDGNCPDKYTLQRRWMATDACGNTATAIQVLTVQDVTNPTFTAVPANVTVSCDAIPAVGTPSSSDNCDASPAIVYIGQTRTNGACLDSYTLTRRWTTTDNCGNTASATQVLTVQDVTAPVFTAVPANVTVSCDAIPPVGTAQATDNCDVSAAVTYSGETRVDGACTDSYTLVRRWTATDNCGNTKTAEQVLTVEDKKSPVFTFVPANAVVNCEAIPTIQNPVASDNCDGNVTVTFAGVTQSSGNCASGGTVARQWIATDNCGNTAMATQLLTVQDTTKPAFTFIPANVTVACDAVPAPGTPVASDNCTSTVDITYDGEQRTNGACPDTYTLMRRWTATDICGNTVTAQQKITVRDLALPAFTFVPANVTVECNAVPLPGTPLATDNCDASVSVTYDGEERTDGACPNTYTLKRYWTATDNCGNRVSANQVLTVQDVTKPVFTSVPADLTSSCESIPAVGSPLATDNCSANVVITFDGETQTAGSCPNSYGLTRRWTATDACGNSASTIQKITVQDITKPVFVAVPADATVECQNVPPVGVPTATDNCSPEALIVYNGETRTDGACPDTYTLVRRWTATDNCGNSVSTQQVLTVRDLTKPVFSFAPANITVSCENVPAAGTPTATDNCAQTVAITYDGETRTDGACTNKYTLTRHWTAIDACGNTRTAEQIITVQDVKAPVFGFVPADATVSCEAVPAVGQPTASDNCTVVVDISYTGETRTDGACPDTYTLTRRWLATDVCGNSTTAVQKLTVRDIIAPVFTSVPPHLTVNCNAVPNVGTPAASDNCDASTTITYDGQSRTDGNCPGNYTLRRIWTAKDNCGNSATATQLITVQDTTRPVLALVPPNAVVSCASIPAVGTPIASDNCTVPMAVVYLGETRVDGACPDTYTLYRRWMATDNCGNSASAEQQLSVQDIEKPVFTSVPAGITVNCENVPAVGAPTATDNCTANVAIAFDGEVRTDGACADSYILKRQWTATDHCGNSTAATQLITVQDNTKPAFTFIPPNATVNCEAIPSLGAPTATDNCDADVTITYEGETYTGGNCASGGVLLRKWIASDNCGNTALATQLLTVQDTTKPVFTYLPAPLTVTCENIPSVDTPKASDNCSQNVQVAYDGETRANGACPDSYKLTRRWTAADACGNARTMEQVITVEDKTKPVFTAAPNNVTVNCEAVPAVGTPVASDNCDSDVSITFDGELRIDGLCPDTYVLRRKWTATDNCGNSTSTEQILTVKDATPPVFTSIPASVTTSCATIPPVVTPTAKDNCAANVTITFNGEVRTNGACPDSYTLRRSWIATDNCGNSTSAEQLVTVEDNIAPKFTAVPGNVTVECSAIPAAGTPVATDNCAAVVNIAYEGEVRLDGPCPDSYLLRRRWSATDNCGNKTTTEQLVTVRDISAPVFLSKPADAVVSCDAVPAPAMPVATDNCDTAVAIDYQGETIISSSSAHTYLMRRRWVATDNCGNATTIDQLISVRDTVAPQLSCPPSVSVAADGTTCDAVATFASPVTADNCSNPVLLTSTAVSGAVYPIGKTTVQLTAKDDSGNSSTCIFTITVADTTKPVLVNCPKDMTVTTPGASCEVLVSWAPPSVTDACDAYPITPIATVAPGTLFPAGFTTVTYTAKDSSGNLLTCSFVVTVNEKVPPVLSNCPADMTLLTDTCTALATWTAPIAADNCALDTLVSNIQPGTVLQEGISVVSYTATDVWGNSVACSFAITVKDIVAPKFSGCPADTVVDALGACSAQVNWKLPTASDNCDADPKVFAIPMPGTDYPVGYTKVLVLVEDPSGNQDTCTFQVTVIGPPLGFADSPLDQSFIGCSATATWMPPAPTGVCGPVTVTSNYDPGATFPVGTTTVLYTVSDTLGNSTTASFNITVTESILPQFDCPVSPVLVDISGAVLVDPSKFLLGAGAVASCDGVMLKFDYPQASDNCAPPAVEQLAGPASDAFFTTGEHVLEFKTTDAAGNSAGCSVKVEVRPLQPLNPEISDAIGCPGDDITLSTPVIPGATYIWTGPKPSYPNANTLLLDDLSPAITGIYTVQARVNGCLTPLDSALVRQAVLPDAVDDLDFEVETGAVLDGINVVLNDYYEIDDYNVTLTSALPGLTETGNGLFSYQAGSDNGRVNFFYRLCSAACPDMCDEAAVTITVRETFCSYIPNVITPNNDDINDYLEIPCLETELYPKNSLVIYNQWGDKVFEASPYDNDPAKAFRGTLNGRPGEPLPDGTYFYFFKPTPEKSPLSGYIEIFR